MNSEKDVVANFIQITYTLTVNVSPSDSGDVKVGGAAPSSYPATYTLANGASVSLEAIASSGYNFANWSGALSTSENPTTITMDSDKEVTANFTKITHTLTVNVSPSNGGDVKVDGATPSSYPATYTLDNGASVSLEAIASSGYNFANWSGAIFISENPTTITMDSDKEIMANFAQITYTLTVNVSPSNGGDVKVDGATPSSYPATYTLAYGASVSLEAVPALGYNFTKWTGDLSGSESTTTITMDSDKEMNANFTQITHTLTVNVSPSDGGNVEVDSAAPSSYPAIYTLAYGASVSLEAIASSGYNFTNWSGALSTSENPTTITMDSDKEVTANFIQITYALTVEPSSGGTVTLDPSQPAEGYVAGTEVTLTAVASAGYDFDHWSGDASGSQTMISITMDSVKEVTANFSQITYTMTVSVSPGDRGMVILDPSQPGQGYVIGTEVTLNAVADEGYDFGHWSGDLSGSENPTTITMDSDKEVTANFNQITHTLTVNVSSSDGGTVTLDPSHPAEGYVAGTEVTLTAVASEGYEFDHWSGELSSFGNPTTMTMDSDKEVTATFTELASSPFPWWWIVVGLVVVGLLLYFLAIRRLWA